MRKLICLAATFTLLSGLAYLHSAPQAGEGMRPTTEDIKTLMRATHKGDDSPLMRLDRQLRTDSPAWSDVEKNARLLLTVGAALERRGLNAGYRDARGYVNGVKALDDAVRKKDREAATTAFARVKSSCASCHKDDMP